MRSASPAARGTSLAPFSSAACCSWKRRSRVSVQRSCTGPAGSTCSQECHLQHSEKQMQCCQTSWQPLMVQAAPLTLILGCPCTCLQACLHLTGKPHAPWHTCSPEGLCTATTWESHQSTSRKVGAGGSAQPGRLNSRMALGLPGTDKATGNPLLEHA